MRSRMRSTRLLSRGLVILGFLAIAAGVMAPAMAVAEAPGNNGTVKVDGGELDNGHANEPHVGCGFSVEWFGFDQDASSTVTFTMQPPTADPNTAGASTSVQFGPYTVDHDGYNQSFDIYDLLKNFTPHPHQGFHVKLETNTTWSNGADSKYKVFWVTGCGPPEQFGSVTLDKVVSGPAPAGDPVYTFTVESSDPGATVQSPVTINASAAPVEVATDVALGSTVTITETDANGASSTSYKVNGGGPQVGAGVEVTVSSADAVAVVATNTFTPPPQEFGSVTLDKVVSGPAPAGDPAYTFTVVSDDPGATVQSPVTIKASAAPLSVASHVALGSMVTITETDANGASSTSYAVDGGSAQLGAGVEVTVSSTTAAAVVATNTFTPPPQEFGSVTLDKKVSGPAPAGDPAYTFTVVSDDPGATVQSPVTIKASDAPVAVATHVALGSKVTITETGANGAASTSYKVNGGAPQHGAGVEVTVSSTSAVAVVARNRFTPPPEQFGSVTLDKVVSGPAPAGDPAYTFTVESSDPGATAQSPVTIKASDAPVEIASHVKLGAKVKITETEAAGATATSFTVGGRDPQSGAAVEVTVSSTTPVAVVAANAFTSVLGETETPPAPTTDGSPTPVQQPLARTGTDQLPLIVFGFAMVAAGLALSVATRRLRTAR